MAHRYQRVRDFRFDRLCNHSNDFVGEHEVRLGACHQGNKIRFPALADIAVARRSIRAERPVPLENRHLQLTKQPGRLVGKAKGQCQEQRRPSIAQQRPKTLALPMAQI